MPDMISSIVLSIPAYAFATMIKEIHLTILSVFVTSDKIYSSKIIDRENTSTRVSVVALWSLSALV